jgi:hypothetical protein
VFVVVDGDQHGEVVEQPPGPVDDVEVAGVTGSNVAG